jgi:protein-L-isoaspartate(D-aspartate) O-methyltransferase
MSEMNFEQARFNMIEQQIRPWEVLDQRVLDVIAAVPREAFVPERYRNLAFADVRLPLGQGQVMMNPNVEGRLLQALQIRTADRILEIGTGSGYLTACLAHLGNNVVSVDIFEDFTGQAQQRLLNHGIRNVALQTGNAVGGWGEHPFDVIVLTASVPGLAEHWQQQLALNGRLFAIIGEEPIMEARLITRTSAQEWHAESLFETEIPALIHSSRPVKFEF